MTYVEQTRNNDPTYFEMAEALQHLINIADTELGTKDRINPFVDNETLLKEVAEQCLLLIKGLGGDVSDFYADTIPLEDYEN